MDARPENLDPQLAWWTVVVVFLFAALMSGHDSHIGGADGSGHGSAYAESLPYAASLRRNNPDDSLAFTVQTAHGQARLQCRVYLDDALVSIGTGDGTGTGEVPRTR